MMRRAFALVAMLTVPLAVAQAPAQAFPEGVEVVEGGGPAFRVLIDGVDLDEAGRPANPIELDPSREANLSLVISPSEGATWHIRGFSIGLLVSGPGSDAPDALSREIGTNTSLPSGFTLFVNRSVDLSAFKPIGAGLFLMQVTLKGEDGGTLAAKSFYVHILGNPLFTVAGAAVTITSVATGYGLWQIARDLREAYQARQRHKAREAKQGKAARTLDAVVGLSGGDVEGAVDVAGDMSKDADRMSKRRPLAWTLTGMGLGAVTLSWAQFLGYVTFDVTNTLVAALTFGALFLTVALVLVALAKRAARALREKAATRTLTPEEPPTVAPPQPVDKKVGR